MNRGAISGQRSAQASRHRWIPVESAFPGVISYVLRAGSFRLLQ